MRFLVLDHPARLVTSRDDQGGKHYIVANQYRAESYTLAAVVDGMIVPNFSALAASQAIRRSFSATHWN